MTILIPIENFYVMITGIGSDVGKSVAAAIWVEALRACYWKPVQCGSAAGGDREKIQRWLGPDMPPSLPERFWSPHSEPPHRAAAAEGQPLRLADIRRPLLPVGTNLVVEGTGGALAPLNDEESLGELPLHLGLSVVIVASPYPGAYNHTLMTVEVLRRRGTSLLGLIFNHTVPGEADRDFATFIRKKTGLPSLLEVPYLDTISVDSIRPLAVQLRERLDSPIFFGKGLEPAVCPAGVASPSP